MAPTQILPNIPVTNALDVTENFEQLETFLNQLEAKLKQPRAQAHSELDLPHEAAGVVAELTGAWGVDFDNEGWFKEEASHLRYTPKKAGLYMVVVKFTATTAALEANQLRDIGAFKNGAVVNGNQAIRQTGGESFGDQFGGAFLFEMNGTTDKLEIMGNSTQVVRKGIATFGVARLSP